MCLDPPKERHACRRRYARKPMFANSRQVDRISFVQKRKRLILPRMRMASTQQSLSKEIGKYVAELILRCYVFIAVSVPLYALSKTNYPRTLREEKRSRRPARGSPLIYPLGFPSSFQFFSMSRSNTVFSHGQNSEISHLIWKTHHSPSTLIALIGTNDMTMSFFTHQLKGAKQAGGPGSDLICRCFPKGVHLGPVIWLLRAICMFCALAASPAPNLCITKAALANLRFEPRYLLGAWTDERRQAKNHLLWKVRPKLLIRHLSGVFLSCQHEAAQAHISEICWQAFFQRSSFSLDENSKRPLTIHSGSLQRKSNKFQGHDSLKRDIYEKESLQRFACT